MSDYQKIDISFADSDREDGKPYFIKLLHKETFDNLKMMLEYCEEVEEYEYCRLIQNEIDARVK